MQWMKLGELLGLDSEEPASAQPEPESLQAVAVQAVSATPGPVSVAPPSLPVQSIRPVVADIEDLDLDDAMAMKPKKRGVFVGIAAAALVLAGIGFAATRGGTSAAAAAPVSVVSPTLPPIVQAPPPAPIVLPALPAAAPAADSPATTTPDTSHLSPSQIKALAEADKAHDSARKAKASAAAARAPRVKSQSQSKPFHKGGNKFDPLNSSI
jgi:rhodanese-related sulfurtransferase